MLAWLEFLDDLVLALVILQGAGAVHSVKCEFWLRLDSSYVAAAIVASNFGPHVSAFVS